MTWADGDLLSPTNLNYRSGFWASPNDYGADTAGTTDATSAFFSAISSAASAGGSNGGLVMVGPGTYKLTNNPFHNRVNTGNAPMVMELYGAKLSSDSQIKLPTSTLVRGSNRLRCGFKSTGSFIGSVAISNITRSSNTITVTTATPHGLPDNGTSIMSGVANVAFNGGYPLYSVTSTSFKYNSVGADTSSSGGTVYIPFVVLGSTDSFDLGTRLECLSIDVSSSATSTVPLYTGNANELSGAENVLIQQGGPVSLWIDDGPGTGCAINYRFENIEILPQPLGTNTGVLVNGHSSGQHRGLDNITVVPISSGGTIRACFSINGAPGLYSRLHGENATDIVVIGERGGVNSANTSSAGIVICGVTAGGSVPATNVIHLSSASEMHDIVVMGISKRGATNILKDDVRSTTLTDTHLSFRAIGPQASPTVFGTSANEAWRIQPVILAASGIEPGSNTAILRSGSGSPEASITQDVGSLWMRSDGTLGSGMLYSKTNGSGNTGWAPIQSTVTVGTSLTSLNVRPDMPVFFIGGSSGASLGIRSGGTLYWFGSSASTVG